MDGAEEEVVIVEEGRPSEVAGPGWGVERELGQELGSIRAGSGQSGELFEVGQPNGRVSITMLEGGLEPGHENVDFDTGRVATALLQAGAERIPHPVEVAPPRRGNRRRGPERPRNCPGAGEAQGATPRRAD